MLGAKIMATQCRNAKAQLTVSDSQDSHHKYLRSGKCYHSNNVAVTRSCNSFHNAKDVRSDGRKELSEDVIREILTRLPLYTVACFKAVSRRGLELVLDPFFTTEYLAGNSVMLGFSYSKLNPSILAPAKFVPLPAAASCCPTICNLLQENVEGPLASKFYSNCLPEVSKDRIAGFHDLSVCSSNGIFVRLQFRPPSCFVSLYNPVSGKSVFLPRPPLRSQQECVENPLLDRLPLYREITHASYRLAVDFYSSQPQVTVVELLYGILGMRVNTYSSKTRSWKSTKHRVYHVLSKHFVLARGGIHLHGVIYWLLKEPRAGVLSYDVHNESFSFKLVNGPEYPVISECFCEQMRSFTYLCDPWSTIKDGCMCRYLGLSQKGLCYIRVVERQKISYWTLDGGRWSSARQYTLQGLPCSLAYGRILSVDRQDRGLLYIRLKSNIYSYQLELQKLRLIHTISLENEGKQIISPIIPYEGPKIPASIPLKDCFISLFGSSLCHKECCWGDQYMSYMISPDAHVHSVGEAEVLANSSQENTRPSWFASQSEEPYRTYAPSYFDGRELVTL